MVDNSDAASVTSAVSTPGNSNAAKQMAKLRDANMKYKNLLKMAKERIQSHEEEMEKMKAALKKAEEKVSPGSASNSMHSVGLESMYYSHDYDLPPHNDSIHVGVGGSFAVVRVCQRIKMDAEDDRTMNFNGSDGNGIGNGNGAGAATLEESLTVYWALIEYEHNLADGMDAITAASTPSKRFLRWRRFRTESALADHVLKNTGEPISLPPYSLSPMQSNQVEEEARQAMAHVTEEFRRFRVRSEVARKQVDATVRALQSNNVQTAKRRIEGEDLASELAQARSDHEQLRALRAETAEQEAQWKEAYDTLLAENNALKSTGSEALLAAQWRQRFETCLLEKEKAENALEMERDKMGKSAKIMKKDDAGKYETKYKDLKESFRLYRKKAKEIFEAQQRGDTAILNLGVTNSEEAKLSYLRNLMVNYLSSDPAVREHMEGAIGTVLKFSSDDCNKITTQKKLHTASSWF